MTTGPSRPSGAGFLRRSFRVVSGHVLLVTGALLLILPGPGLVVLAAGLTMLRAEYRWADRLLVRVRARIPGSSRGGGRLLVGLFGLSAGGAGAAWWLATAG